MAYTCKTDQEDRKFRAEIFWFRKIIQANYSEKHLRKCNSNSSSLLRGFIKENVTLITKILGEIPDTTMASFGPQVSKKTIANIGSKPRQIFLVLGHNKFAGLSRDYYVDAFCPTTTGHPILCNTGKSIFIRANQYFIAFGPCVYRPSGPPRLFTTRAQLIGRPFSSFTQGKMADHFLWSSVLAQSASCDCSPWAI